MVDGWSQTYECVETLLSIKNLVSVKGNHDDWWLTYLQKGEHPAKFLQGSKATYDSYVNSGSDFKKHLQFFENQLPYFVDEFSNVYVHGGFNRHYPLAEQPKKDIYWWDRDLLLQAMSAKTITDPRYSAMRFKDGNKLSRIFLGHTTTTLWSRYDESNKKVPNDKPMFVDRIVNLDTGAGFDGRLTIMDTSSLEYWQSDPVQILYSTEKGRN